VFGVSPPCETCHLPELWPENQIVWEIYQILASAGDGIKIDVIGLLDKLQITQPLRFLRRLAAVQRVAWDNAMRIRDNAARG